jgi:hypothetical protein
MPTKKKIVKTKIKNINKQSIVVNVNSGSGRRRGQQGKRKTLQPVTTTNIHKGFIYDINLNRNTQPEATPRVLNSVSQGINTDAPVAHTQQPVRSHMNINSNNAEYKRGKEVITDFMVDNGLHPGSSTTSSSSSLSFKDFL